MIHHSYIHLYFTEFSQTNLRSLPLDSHSSILFSLSSVLLLLSFSLLGFDYLDI